jgi:protein TonB
MKWESVSAPEPRGSKVRLVVAILAVLCATIVSYLSFFAEPVMTISPFSDSSSDSASSPPAATETSAAGPASPADTSPSSVVTVSALAPEVTPVETPKKLIVLVTKMNAPEQNTRTDRQDAPELGANAGEEPAKAAPQASGGAPGRTPGLLGAMGSPQPPPPEDAPVAETSEKHEDPMIPARLVSSQPPSYPLLARQAHVEGDVTIEAQIDATGKVTGTKVLSGPQLLREAAVSALARWKFEPARLRNQPAASTTTVTVHFRLN